MLPNISTFPGSGMSKQIQSSKKKGHAGAIVSGIIIALIVAGGAWTYITRPPFAVSLYHQALALMSVAPSKPAGMTPMQVLAQMNAKLASMHNGSATLSFTISTTTIADADLALSSDVPLIKVHTLALQGNLSGLLEKWIGFDSATGGPLSPAQLSGIRTAILKSALFTVVQDMTDPQNATAPFTYQATLDKNALLNLSATIATISGSAPTREALASFKADLDASSLPSVTLWIDRVSYLPIKIQLTGYLSATEPYSILISVNQLGALTQGMSGTAEELTSANAITILKNALVPAPTQKPTKKPATKKIPARTN